MLIVKLRIRRGHLGGNNKEESVHIEYGGSSATGRWLPLLGQLCDLPRYYRWVAKTHCQLGKAHGIQHGGNHGILKDGRKRYSWLPDQCVITAQRWRVSGPPLHTGIAHFSFPQLRDHYASYT